MPDLILFFKSSWHEYRNNPDELLSGYREVMINKEISDYYEQKIFNEECGG